MKRAALLPCLLLGGCAGLQTPLDPAGAQSQLLLGLLGLMLGICGLAYAAVLAFLAWSIRRAGRRAENGPPVIAEDGTGLKRVLWGWGTFVGGGLLVLATASFLTDSSLARAERNAALEIRVTGHQWWWRIQYRDPASGGWIETANELHLPANRTARITLDSADVIHSFWIPNLSGKKDAIPGRINLIAVTPHRTGWFRGQCAEFCGAQHANMAVDVKVDDPAAFDAWLAAQARPAAAASDAAVARGQRIVTAGPCASCHVIRGTAATGKAGPDLTHVASRRSLAGGVLPMSRGALQGWMLQPRAIKPGTMMPPIPLPAADADAASRYLASLQ